jgi:hypothetical protein
MMNRRGFLSLFAAASTAAVIDLDELVWTPGRKLISIPARRASGNRIMVPEEYARYALAELQTIMNRWNSERLEAIRYDQTYKRVVSVDDLTIR